MHNIQNDTSWVFIVIKKNNRIVMFLWWDMYIHQQYNLY